MNSCIHFKDVKNIKRVSSSRILTSKKERNLFIHQFGIQKPHSCKATPLEKDTSEIIATKNPPSDHLKCKL